VRLHLPFIPSELFTFIQKKLKRYITPIQRRASNSNQATAFKRKSSLTMDALIAMNRRELEIASTMQNLQTELEKIRSEKTDLLASLAKPVLTTSLLTPTKVKDTAVPTAPKKPAITIRRRSDSSSISASAAAVAAAIAVAAPAAPPAEAAAEADNDSAVKHWKAFKKTKADQIAAAQLTSGKPWGKARVKTAIRNAYTLEHPAQAATLNQLEKTKDATKAPRAPSEWLQYVAAVKAELRCSHHDAMVEAGRRRRATAKAEA